MKKISLIFLLLLICITPIIAQSLTDAYKSSLPKIVPSTPQSQIFEKYVNHPVTEYNGLPEINIPLYEIEVNGLKIPITLSYHASGIKYDFSGYYIGSAGQSANQLDGDVGAGWSMSAGGYRIARNINGKPDEKYPLYKESDAKNYLSVTDNTVRDSFLASLYFPFNGQTSKVKNTTYPYKESEYDIFTYILPSKNGHFIFNENKVPVIIEQHSDKITADANLDDFTITDDKGFTYYMGKRPDNNLLVEKRNIDAVNNEKVGWPVKRITSPFNKNIDFKYEEFKFGVGAYSSIPIKEAYLLTWQTDEREYPPYSDYCSVDPYGMNRINSYSELLVSEISSDYEVVKFKRNKSNLPKNLVDEIEIRDKAGNLIKTITFEYSLPTKTNWHCLLKSIIIKGKTTTTEQKYSFDYYDAPSTDFKGTFPDQWGYYAKGSTYNSTVNNYDKGLFIHSEVLDYNIINNTNLFGKNLYYPSAKIKDSNVGSTIKGYTTDRSKDNPAPYCFSLKKITYPTGGTREYIYEPNKYYYQKTITGGGQRIKKIISCDTPSNPSIVTEYKYGENENGLGIANFNLEAVNFSDKMIIVRYVPATVHSPISQNVYAATNIVNCVRTFSSKPLVAEMSDFKVEYEYVSTYSYNKDATKSNGKTVSKYKIPVQYKEDRMGYISFGCQWYPQLGVYSGDANYNRAEIKEYRLGLSPNLISRETYDSNQKLIQKEVFNYRSSQNPLAYKGIKTKQKVFFDDQYYTSTPNNQLFYLYSFTPSLFLYLEYSIFTGIDLLSSKETTIYNQYENNAITTNETYEYDTKNRVTKSTRSGSLNGILLKEYTYPAVNSELEKKNMVSTVIKTKTMNNSRWIGTIENVYPSTSILASAVRTSTSDESGLATDISFERYDAAGNLQQYTTMDGLTTTYLWSYNKRYPVAEVKNATLSEVEAQLGTTAEVLSQSSTPDFAKIEALKSKMPNTQVSVFKFKPLVGLISSAQPSGLNTTYEYDNFGRLETIKDHDSKKISYYKYGYNNGQSLPVENSPELNPELYPLMELDLPANASYSVNKVIPAFYIAVEGGSGSFTYSWYLKNASNTIISQKINTADKFFDVGKLKTSEKMELSCVVTDSKTKKTKTAAKKFDALITPVESFLISSSTEYKVNLNSRFSIPNLIAGSGSFTYSWTLKYADGQTLQKNNATDNYYDITFTKQGNATLTCVVKDAVTQGTRQESISIYIQGPPIEFSNIQTTNTNSLTSTLTAKLQCYVKTDITFEIEAICRTASTLGSSTVTIWIGSQSTTISTISRQDKTYSLPVGITDIKIEIKKTSTSSNQIGGSIMIKSVQTTENKIGLYKSLSLFF